MILSPIDFPSGARAKNRVMLAPLTSTQSQPDGRCSDDELRFLARRARGGFGLVMTCAAHVTPAGQGFARQLGCFDDAHDAGLRAIAEAVASQDALSLVQLYHGGARCPSGLTGAQPVSASAFTEDRPGFEVPRPMTEAEILDVISAFRAAALRASRAGFSGVEIHGAHGYLLSQFLSRAMNLRTDGWGGDLGGRARLTREIARTIRGAVPPPFVVGVRLSPEDFGQARGLDVDETVEVARMLADDGVDFVHLSLWDYRRMTAKHPEAHALRLARAALGDRVRVVAAGKIWTREDAERVLELGADVVALGRAAIANPDWPRLARGEGFAPKLAPLTPAELAERDVGPRFVEYLRGMRMVHDGP